MKTMLPVLFFTIFCLPVSAKPSSPVNPADFSAYDNTYSVQDTVGCLTKTAYFRDDSFFSSGEEVVSYIWNFGDGVISTDFDPQPVHTYNAPGVYTVTMTISTSGGNTFIATKTGYIIVGSSFTVDLGPDQDLCDGSTLTLSGGTADANILWNTGETSTDITVWDPGMYTVAVTENGCTAKDSVNITWKPEIALNFGFAKVGGCLPVDMKFTDSSVACTGSIIGWSWDFGDGSTSTDQNPVHTFTSRGQFRVGLTVTASSGSTSSGIKRVVINPATVSVDLGPDTTICFGESLILDAKNPGAAYSWSTNESSQQITVSDDGTYSVSVTKDGCVANDTINVRTGVSALSDFGYRVGGNCLPITVTFSDSSKSFCGQSIVSWKWNFGDGTTSTQRDPIHVYSTADSFSVKLTVTASGGTTSIRTKKVVVSNTTFSVDLPAELKVCRGGSVALDAVVTGAQYSWSPSFGLSASNIRNPQLTPAMTGLYTVVVTKCSVSKSDSVLITIDSIARPVIKQEGNSLKSPDATTYQWLFEGKAIAGTSGQSIRVDRAGYYVVKVTSSSGCISQSDPYFYIPVSGNEKTVGGLRMKISPNPANGAFNVLLSGIPSKAAVVSVYDASGKRVLVTTVQNHVNRIDSARFMKGLYFVEIVINTERTILPVVLQ